MTNSLLITRIRLPSKATRRKNKMTSFRPRAIDIDKPLVIMKKELNDEETRTMPMISTGMESHEENESHIRQALIEAQRKSTRITADIPTPVVKEVPTYEADSARWDQPPSYIHVTPPVHLLFQDPLDDPVEYDVDSEDEEWLDKEINKNGVPVLSEYDFELLIDTFEKTLAREQIIAYNPNLNLLEWNIALEAAQELGKNYSSPVIETVYNYWKQKRAKKNGTLLLSLVPPPAYDNPSPYVPFRPRERETKKKSRKNDMETLLKLKGLQCELEKGKSLLEAVGKREKMKKEYLLARSRIFKLRLLQREQEIRHPSDNPPHHLRGRKLYSFESSDEEVDEELDEPDEQAEADPDTEMEDDTQDTAEEPPLFPHSRWDQVPEHYHNEENNPPGEHYWGTIRIPTAAPFRGRVRMGRGGRIYVDRASSRVPRKEPVSPILYY